MTKKSLKKRIIRWVKRISVSILLVGIVSGAVGCLLIFSFILGVASPDRTQYLRDSMFYVLPGMGILLLLLSWLLLTGKHKLSSKELKERAKRRPDLVCKNCGQMPTLHIDYDGGSKTLYGNRCPYCGHRLF